MRRGGVETRTGAGSGRVEQRDLALAEAVRGVKVVVGLRQPRVYLEM